MELWLPLKVWKAEIIQTPYTEFDRCLLDRCLLYCQLFNKAPLWLVQGDVNAYVPTPRTVHSGAPVMWVLVFEYKGPWKKGLLGNVSQ